MLAAVFVVVWSIYGAVFFFEGRLPDYLRQAFRLDVATESGILSPLAGSEAHAAVAQVRIILSGLFVAIALLGGLLAWRLRGITSRDITVLAIAVGCGIAAVGIGAGYVHELYQRVFVFLLPVMAYFGVKLLHLRTTTVVLCLLLLIAMPLAFISKYGSQGADYLSSGYLSGARFFQDNTVNGYVIGGAPIGSMEYYERYGKDLSYGDLEWEDNQLVRFGYLGSLDSAPRYVIISDHDRATLDFYYNEPQLINDIESNMDEATNCNLVYANSDLSLYIRQTQMGK
jgi:hypothetical protein